MPDRTSSPEEHVFLQPIVAPSALGLLGFAGATFLAGAKFAGWLSGSMDQLVPILLMLGGIAQFAAGMWAFKGRDAIAASMHTIWGSHWLGFGTLHLLFVAHLLTQPTPTSPELGWWYLMLGGLTLAGAIAATGENAGILSMLTTLTGGCVVMGIGQLTATRGLIEASGYVFAVSAACAWYTALCLILQEVFGHPVLPVGHFPAARRKQPWSSGFSEPGVTRGQ